MTNCECAIDRSLRSRRNQAEAQRSSAGVAFRSGSKRWCDLALGPCPALPYPPAPFFEQTEHLREQL